MAHHSTPWAPTELLALFCMHILCSFMPFLLLECPILLYLPGKVPTQLTRFSSNSFSSVRPSCTTLGWIHISPLGSHQGPHTTPGVTIYTGAYVNGTFWICAVHGICSPHGGQSPNLHTGCYFDAILLLRTLIYSWGTGFGLHITVVFCFYSCATLWVLQEVILYPKNLA